MLLDALREAEVMPAAPLLLGAGEAKLDPFRAGLLQLAERAPAIHAQRMDELAYLANVLVAGTSRGGRAYRPVEAVEAVIETCSAGLAEAIGAAPTAETAADLLARHGADRLFRIGWRLRSA